MNGIPRLSRKFHYDFIRDYDGTISKLIAEQGEIAKVEGRHHNLYILSNPNDIKHVMFENNAKYVRTPNKVIDSLVEEYRRPDSQALWKKDRATAIKFILGEDVVRSHAQLVINTTTEYLKKWEVLVQEKKPVVINSEFSSIALTNLTKLLFSGIQLNLEYVKSLVKESVTLLQAYEVSYTKLPWYLPTKMRARTNQLIKNMHTLGDQIVEYCLAATTENIVKIIAQIHYPNSTQLDTKAKTYLRERTLMFLTGGFDSSAASITQIFIYLSLYPEIAKKVYEEVKNNIGERQLTMEDLHLLPYTTAVFRETKRLSSVPYIPRIALEEDKIGLYVIHKNDRIIIPTFYMHRLPQYWENPEGFNPERFITPLDEHRYRFVYLPYSAGPRGCPGRNFAPMQAILITAMVVQKYRLYLAKNPPRMFHPLALMTIHPAKDYT